MEKLEVSTSTQQYELLVLTSLYKPAFYKPRSKDASIIHNNKKKLKYTKRRIWTLDIIALKSKETKMKLWKMTRSTVKIGVVFVPRFD